MVNEIQEYWRDKIKLFIHDPPDKALDIKKHEERAKSIYDTLYIEHVLGNKYLDSLASKIQRVSLPGFYGSNQIQYEYTKNIHPLSANTIKKVVASEFEVDKLSILKTENMRDLFFRLWYYLPKIYPECQMLPAETRYPSHSILNHNDLTAALHINKNGKDSSIGLLIFKILSPQNIISTVKKWSDLWGGSTLISLLTFEAMKEIIENYGPSNIIFPSIRENPLLEKFFNEEELILPSQQNEISITFSSLPHIFTAIVDINSFDKILDGICSRINKFIEEHIDKLIKNAEIKDIIIRQIKTAIQFRVAASEFLRKDNYSQIDQDFPKDLQNKLASFFNNNLYDGETIAGYYYPTLLVVLNLLGKAPRIPLFGAEHLSLDNLFPVKNSKKCSLCGTFSKQIAQKDLQSNINPHYIGCDEELCGFCFLKRYIRVFYGRELQNMNLCWIADPEWFEEFSKFLGQKYDTLNISILLENGFDLEWLYDLERENLQLLDFHQNLRKGNSLPFEDSTFRELYNNFKEYWKQKYQVEIPQPNKYYCILMMDGDRMGSLLTGEGRESLISYFPEEIIQEVRNRTPDIIPILQNNKPLLDPAYQHFFSNALGYYSLKCVPKICQKNKGNLIYSGGDDILALFHPEYAVNAAFELNKVFGKEILDDQFIYGLGQKASLSGTILTAHIKYPLSLALKKAREFEFRAKSYYRRNCIVLGFIKHSGELLEGPLFYDAIEYLENMFEIMSTNKISRTFIQELAKNDVIFRDLDLFYDEFNRILKHKISEKENKQQIIEEMQTNLKNLLNIYQMRLNESDLSHSYIETGFNVFRIFYELRQKITERELIK